MRLAGGQKNQPPGYHYSSADYDQFQIILVTAGEVGMLVHETVTLLRPGAVCFLPVGSAFSLSCDASGAGYRGIFSIYTDLAEDDAALQAAVGPLWTGPARPLRSSPELRQIGDLLRAEMQQPRRRSRQLHRHLCGCFMELGIRLAAEQDEELVGRPENAAFWVERASQVIERSIYANQFVEQTVRDIGIGYRQLCRHFRAVRGQTPKQYQLRCRLQEAKRLLHGTNQSVTAIALDLGFSSSQHFATVFRRLEGTTPSAFRRRQA